MDVVFAEFRMLTVYDEAALLVTQRMQTFLYAFAKTDILVYQHVLDVVDETALLVAGHA